MLDLAQLPLNDLKTTIAFLTEGCHSPVRSQTNRNDCDNYRCTSAIQPSSSNLPMDHQDLSNRDLHGHSWTAWNGPPEDVWRPGDLSVSGALRPTSSTSIDPSTPARAAFGQDPGEVLGAVQARRCSFSARAERGSKLERGAGVLEGRCPKTQHVTHTHRAYDHLLDLEDLEHEPCKGKSWDRGFRDSTCQRYCDVWIGLFLGLTGRGPPNL